MTRAAPARPRRSGHPIRRPGAGSDDQKRGAPAVPALALATAAGFLGAGAAALWYLGAGGYRGGFFLVAGLLAGGGGALAWWLLRGAPGRLAWVLTVVLLGLAAAGALVDRAPWSAGRLAAAMDGVRLPFYRLDAEERSGSSSCRPACPRVRREYRGPDVNPEPALVEVAAALAAAGYPLDLPVEARRRARFTVRTEDVAIEVTSGRRNDHARVTISFTALRRR